MLRRHRLQPHAAWTLALLTIAAIAFLLPLAWMVSTSLKPLGETMARPVHWIPASIQWRNYPDAIAAMGSFWRFTANTLFVCAMNVAGTLISSSLAAYGFSRIQWKGRDALFTLLLGTMMIPFPVLMVPIYTLFKQFGWIGSFRPLWVPSFFAAAFNVFMLRQFFLAIPKEISEAARIDGCSEVRIFLTILLPLCKPALVIVALFQFIFNWNDFLAPLIYMTDQHDYTLALALQSFQSQSGGTAWHYLMAATALVILPILVLFLVAQRALIEGIAFTGGKN